MSTRHIAAMLLLMLLIPCVSHAGLFSSKKNLIEGDWYRGTGIQPTKPMLHFENGVITVWANGRVFGTYEFIGGNRVRFKRTVQDFETITIADDKGNDQEFEMPTVSRVDVIIFIEFQSDDRMLWYRIIGDKKLLWLTFSRFKK